jgi:hypothetical protein
MHVQVGTQILQPNLLVSDKGGAILTGITNFGRNHLDDQEDDEILDVLVAGTQLT